MTGKTRGTAGSRETVCRAGRMLHAGSGALAGPREMGRVHTGGTGQMRTAQAQEKVERCEEHTDCAENQGRMPVPTEIQDAKGSQGAEAGDGLRLSWE